jgi:hypothetical protein
MSGIRTSVMRASNRPFLSSSRASTAEAAQVTSYPHWVRASLRRRRIDFSSSTTRILAASIYNRL